MTRPKASEGPGISVFFKDASGDILHTYSTYARGLDKLNGAYHLLDRTPLGRNEKGAGKLNMYWLRRSDRYDDQPLSIQSASGKFVIIPQCPSGHRLLH